ncbi:Uncharacterised protein [uncultured archaeon]|nr:Uncharacterised protein [uncultured archaeon]
MKKAGEIKKRLCELDKKIVCPSIYFGHPVNFYDTDKERELMKVIEKKFDSYHIENPNQKHHQENYQIWKEVFGNGMKYYFEHVLPRMSGGIFLPFEDGMWGAGIFGEAEFLYDHIRDIFQIDMSGKIEKIFRLDPKNKLSPEETRERTSKRD